MGDLGIVPVISILSGLASGASSIYGMFNRPSTPGLPTPQPQDTSQISRTLLPGAKADAAARTGGGISPEFIASLIGQQSGTPSGGLDILSDIRRSMNVPEA
jgi:hypothetical protein